MDVTAKSTLPVILVTGSARRIGRAIVQCFHDAGYRVVVHYRHSKHEAQTLCNQLNATRSDSAVMIQAELSTPDACEKLITDTTNIWQRLDVLVNNASDYFPTQFGNTTLAQWEQLIQSNLMAPFFLAQAAAPHLKKQHGNLINLIDIHAEKPLKGYDVYCSAKAGLRMLTQSLAKTLAPDVRVNGVAPGATLWPEYKSEISDRLKQDILLRTPLQKLVDPIDIARTILFCTQNPSMTGEIIRVDCGRSLHM